MFGKLLLPLKLIKRTLFKDKRAEIGAQYSQKILQNDLLDLVDVGAARGLQPHWKVFEQSSRMCLIEPNEYEHAELKSLYGYLGDRIHYIQDAVSEKGGPATLYVTNVSTGTSLLRPSTSNWGEYLDRSYYFPIKEVQIKTQTLESVLNSLKMRNDLLKIDVQGAELQVLKGLGEERLKNLLCLEVEIGVPGGYEEQGTIGQVVEYMERFGLSLFDIRAARITRPKNNDQFYYHREIFNVCDDAPSLSWRIWEVDAVFIKKPEVVLASRDEPALRRLVVIFCGYGYFAEAYALIENAEFIPPQERESLQKTIVDWHRTQNGGFLYSRGPLARFMRKSLGILAPKNNRRWMQYCYYQYPHG